MENSLFFFLKKILLLLYFFFFFKKKLGLKLGEGGDLKKKKKKKKKEREKIYGCIVHVNTRQYNTIRLNPIHTWVCHNRKFVHNICL